MYCGFVAGAVWLLPWIFQYSDSRSTLLIHAVSTLGILQGKVAHFPGVFFFFLFPFPNPDILIRKKGERVSFLCNAAFICLLHMQNGCLDMYTPVPISV